jgi:hypothetical protein
MGAGQKKFSWEKEFQGKKGRIYIYKFMYKGEEGGKENWYVAISGLQPLNKKVCWLKGKRPILPRICCMKRT